MPLLDHYRRPLYPTRPPESFLAAWLGGIADVLNVVLPPDYRADGLPHAGRRWDIDADPWEDVTPQIVGDPPPTRASAAVPVVLADDAEVRVIGPVNGGLRVVGVVGLVKPANKMTEAARRVFAAKWASYLSQGVGVVLVDIVTTDPADLHRETMALLGHPDAAGLTGGPYAVAYQPIIRQGPPQVYIWPESLAVGSPLPTLPLWIDAVTAFPIDLEATYTDACQRRRIPG